MEKKTKVINKVVVSDNCWKEVKILSIQNDTSISEEVSNILEKLAEGKRSKKVKEIVEQ